MNLHDLATAWINFCYASEESAEKENGFWAFDEVVSLTELHPQGALSLISLVIELDHSEKIVANLGAGPLEDLLVYHGDSCINKVVQKINEDENWKRVAQNVWQNAMSDRVWQQLQGAIK